MANDDRVPELAALAREHHMHFDVTPDVVIRGEQRISVGFEVRLWATHARGAQALPGCPKCRDLAASIRPLAEWAIPSERRPTRIEIEPFHPALYDSRELPGADEIAVAIAIAHRDRWDAPVDACEERCLKEIRQRLRTIGIRER